MQMQKEINLIPNCSEATFRIDISTLTDAEIDKIILIWEHHVHEKDEDGDDYTTRDGSVLESKTILGKRILEADGDFPYNCGNIVEHIVETAEKAIGKKLVTESEQR